MSREFGAMPMVSSEGGDADSERTGTIPSQLSLFVLHQLFLDSQNWTACCFPPTRRGRHRASVSAFRTLAPLHARSYTRHIRTLAFALAPPPCACITPDLPPAVRQTPTFGDVGTFVPSASEPRPRTPRTAPALPLRQTVTSVPAPIPLILHLCLPLFAVHLARTAPPPYCTHPLPSPHSSLHLSWSSPSIWLSTASASGARIRLLVLIHSRTLAGVSFAYSRMYPTYIASCISRVQHSSSDTLPLAAL
ncbi:hypothetical protein B0H13DRAFT_2534046 [Mycena leptocephala]|nr:hypothetical protein B0H13DRAFT_2534046 [Mycena leptocephala]